MKKFAYYKTSVLAQKRPWYKGGDVYKDKFTKVELLSIKEPIYPSLAYTCLIRNSNKKIEEVYPSSIFPIDKP